MDITLDRPLMKAEFSVNQERNRLLGRIDVIKKELKSPRTLTIGIICTLAVWQIVLLIQLKLTKDKLKKLPEERVELVKPIALSSPQLTSQEMKPPIKKINTMEDRVPILSERPSFQKSLSEKKEIKSIDQEGSDLLATPTDLTAGVENNEIKQEKQLDPEVIKIQKAERRCLAKNQFKSVIRFATNIQTLARGSKARKQFQSKKKSITKIQSCVRGMLIRIAERQKRKVKDEKRLKLKALEKAHLIAQNHQNKADAFAKLKMHMIEGIEKELRDQIDSLENLFKPATLSENIVTKEKENIDKIEKAHLIAQNHQNKADAFAKLKMHMIEGIEKELRDQIDSLENLFKLATLSENIVTKEKENIDKIEKALLIAQNFQRKKSAFEKLKNHVDECDENDIDKLYAQVAEQIKLEKLATSKMEGFEKDEIKYISSNFVTIQRVFRGYLARRKFHEQKAAAISIESFARGTLKRKHIADLKAKIKEESDIKFAPLKMKLAKIQEMIARSRLERSQWKENHPK